MRFPSDRGIAGHVFTTGVTIDIPDAQVDSRFNPEFDEETGFVTRSVLCVPVINKRGEVIGASQALSRTTGPYHLRRRITLKSVHGRDLFRA
ncbi:MAG TPA: GAF domain-containing protein [Nitrospirales bacterium]|nr:GAF domain-containing protein [Nitrospirales bacterium]